jgi:hypothetical protein
MELQTLDPYKVGRMTKSIEDINPITGTIPTIT